MGILTRRTLQSQFALIRMLPGFCSSTKHQAARHPTHQCAVLPITFLRQWRTSTYQIAMKDVGRVHVCHSLQDLRAGEVA